MLHRSHRLAAALTAAVAALCVPAATAAVRPDPERASQWALQGDSPMGAASAWAQITGGDVTVAVVDTGVDLTHPDLLPNLWTNPGEIPGNGVDDDGDGFVDDVHGADFFDHDGDPSDDNGHGTHVAGIVAARGGNGIGIAGVAWRARIMAVKVLGPDAAGDMVTVAQGIRYAVAHGARIVNLSLTGPSPGADLAAALDQARAAGVIVVAAAGNTRADDDAAPAYPAALAAPNLVTATSIDQRGTLAPTASYGRVSVDLAAPGEDILSTARGGGYELRSGTSMAAAQVSGALVLLASARPDLGWDALRGALLGAARPSALPVAAGRLDVAAALRSVLPGSRWRSQVSALRASGGRPSKHAGTRAHGRAAHVARHARLRAQHSAIARAAVPR
jgi:subtilisin family serine protease